MLVTLRERKVKGGVLEGRRISGCEKEWEKGGKKRWYGDGTWVMGVVRVVGFSLWEFVE